MMTGTSGGAAECFPNGALINNGRAAYRLSGSLVALAGLAILGNII
jgi:hypothetical protein